MKTNKIRNITVRTDRIKNSVSLCQFMILQKEGDLKKNILTAKGYQYMLIMDYYDFIDVDLKYISLMDLIARD